MLIVLTVIFGIALAIFVVIAVRSGRRRSDGGIIAGIILSVFSLAAFVVSSGLLMSYSADIATAHIIDSKIQMYEEENEEIEEKINVAVLNYLEHEQSTLTGLNPENAMAILAAYPELKSDTLVSAQVAKYISNSEEIKALRTAKIDIAMKKWWVYFGG